MLFFKCRVCAEKDLRIADLQAQVETLKALATPPTSASRIPLLTLEADAVMNGAHEPIKVENSEKNEFQRIESEAYRLLSGTWDQ
jgi:hypothetical protein